MKKTFFAGLVAAAAVLAGVGGAQAQTIPLSFEARLDAGFPVGDAADFQDMGVGYGITAALQATPLFAIYGGYSRFEFEYDDFEGDRKSDGLELGGRVTLGTGGGIYNPFFQIGALLHEDDTGLEVGLGGFYPVAQNLSVTPLLRYRTVGDLDYVTAGVGLNVRF